MEVVVRVTGASAGAVATSVDGAPSAVASTRRQLMEFEERREALELQVSVECTRTLNNMSCSLERKERKSERALLRSFPSRVTWLGICSTWQSACVLRRHR